MNMKKLLSWMLALLLIAGIAMPLIPATAVAEEHPEGIGYIPDSTVVYMKSPAEFYLYYDGASVKDIKKLKSSNTAVATVKKYKDPYSSDTIIIKITPKKVGKTTVSFSLKYEGKTYKYKMQVNVRKYVNPFKSFKIGKTRYEEYLDKAAHTSAINAHIPLKKTLKNQKMSFKLKDGWKLQEIYMKSKGKWTEDVQNNQKVTFKKGDEIDFYIMDPKGFCLWFYFFFD